MARAQRAADAFRVCDTCRGHGKIVNPVLSVWTESDRADDPEGFDEMLAGTYDVTCPECQGLRVVNRARRAEYRDEESDRRVRLYESGIYPGSPDWY